jgi:NADPH:quinone reductase-like Zn-dependent oxidoreductase/acyl carrier protein
VISNVTGGRVDGATLGQPAYWRQHARAAVRFAAGVQSLADLGCTAFLEIGPDPILIGLGQRSIDRPGAAWLATLRRGRDDWSQVAASLAALYELGAPIDWAAFDQGFPRQRVVLPTYPFQRERFWLEPQPAIARGPRPAAVEPVHPLLGRRVRSALAAQQFEIELTAGMLPLIDDHRIGGAAILPATGFIEMMLAAGGQSFGPGGKSLEDLTIVEPLPVPRIVQVILTPREDGRADCQICSAPAGESQPEAWRLHATAIIGAAVVPSHAVDVESTRRQCPHELTASAHYETLRQLGNDFGPALQTVRRMWTGERHAIAELAVHADAADSDARFHLHPAMLDGCFQMLVDSPAAKAAAAADEGYLPVGLDRLTVYEPCGPEAIGTLQLRADDAAAARLLVGDVDLVGPAGQLIAVASGVRFARASRQAIRRARQEQLDSVYAIQWRDASDDAVPSGNDRLPRRWLVFADRNGIGAEAARRLEEPGDRVLVVVDAPDEEFSAANGVLRMDARRDDHFAALASLVLADREPAGLVHLWTLDAADPNETGDSGALLHAVETGGGSTLRLMQHLGPAAPVAGIWLVTRGAEFPLQAGRPVSPAHAAVLGFARSLGRERPQVRCATVDLDPAQADHASELVDAVRAGGVEDRFALREGHRYVARLARLDAERQPPPAADEQVQLEVVNRGLLDSLALRPATRRAPGAGEIEVRVAACGMNFRDVLNALGMYEGAPVPLGTECAGVVTAVGAGVSRVKVGDAVAGMAPASFSRFAVGQAGHFVRIPASLTMIEAATIPVAFLTADYALNVLARMKRGDRVLIHAGAGGVGLAAIQLAQQAGAEVFATAGSEEKRRFLRSLGVRHVMSSRSLDFKAQILAATDRRGLDIVLNSLTGDFIAASFDVLANGGRFLEIGKKGIWTEGEASQRRPDARYFTIFLGDVDTPVVSRRFEELMAAFERGTLRPLPATVFPLDQAPRAFRFMAQARHIGKVIVVPDGSIGSGRSREIRADGTYLITGGYGALGLATAKWLASRGARAIALVGRRGPSEQARPSLEALEAQGVRVHCATGDVAQLDDVERIVGELTAALPPLRGIVHAAGVLDDGVVEHQTWSRCAAVVAPKAAGAWNLHRASRTLPLDFFFCFSSIAAAFGSAGQTTYGAANAFLDGFADHRRALGLPALSIAWGPWAEGGMAASMDARNRSRLARTGLELMTTEQATAVLDFALRHDGASLVAARVSWREYLAQFDAAVPPLFADLNKAVDVRAGGRPRPHDGGDLKREIEAAPVKRRRSILLARVRAEAVNVLGLAGSAPLDGSRPLNELGLDSLMAIELRNTLSRAIGRPLPATLLFKAPSVAALADALLEELEGAAAAEPSRKPVAQPTAAVLDDLSDDEVKEGLAAELEALTRKGWAD